LVILSTGCFYSELRVVSYIFVIDLFFDFQLPFFEHVGVKTLLYLDTLLQRENLQKSQFFKGLPKILPQMPKVISLNVSFYAPCMKVVLNLNLGLKSKLLSPFYYLQS